MSQSLWRMKERLDPEDCEGRINMAFENESSICDAESEGWFEVSNTMYVLRHGSDKHKLQPPTSTIVVQIQHPPPPDPQGEPPAA